MLLPLVTGRFRLLLLVLLVTRLLWAQEPVAYPEQSRLHNGVRIQGFPSHNPGRVAFAVLVGVGSRHEESHQTGIAHFLEHCLFRSTRQRSFKQLTEELRAHSADENGVTTKEYTGYHVQVPVAHAEWAARWLGEMLCTPALLPEDVDAERKIVYEEIDANSPHVDAVTVDGTLYKGHPLGRTVGGDKAGFGAIGVAELRSFWSRWYRAGNVVVAFAAPAPLRESCREWLGEAFAGLPAGDVAQPADVPQPAVGRRNLRDPEAWSRDRSAWLFAGWHVRTRSAERYAALLILERALGELFFDEVRVARHLSYAPSVELHAYRDAWRLEFQSRFSEGSKVDQVEQAVQLVAGKATGLEPTHFARARAAALAALEPGSASALLDAVASVHVLRASEPEADLRALLQQASAESVGAVARAEFTESGRYLITDAVSGLSAAGGGGAAAALVSVTLVVLVLLDSLVGFAACRALWSLLLRLRVRRRPAPNDVADQLAGEIHLFYQQQDRRKW